MASKKDKPVQALNTIIVFATHSDDSTSKHKAFLVRDRKAGIAYGEGLCRSLSRKEIREGFENTVNPEDAAAYFRKNKHWNGQENGVRLHRTRA